MPFRKCISSWLVHIIPNFSSILWDLLIPWCRPAVLQVLWGYSKSESFCVDSSCNCLTLHVRQHRKLSLDNCLKSQNARYALLFFPFWGKRHVECIQLIIPCWCRLGVTHRKFSRFFPVSMCCSWLCIYLR
jgi:hypothetical protein